jgi:flagellar M-ring protein FliF
MRAAELGVLAVVAVLMILFIVKPMLSSTGGGGGSSGGGNLPMLPGQPVTRIAATADGQPMQLTVDPVTGQLALPGPGSGGGELDQKIDIARIEGQVKASSVKRVAEFVERHPEESVAILRSWLHET